MNAPHLAILAAGILALSACDNKISVKPVNTNAADAKGDAERGKIALTQYACHACHMIPGITGSEVFVGPSLDGVASRPLIAGSLPNTQANMLAWIRHPTTIDPQTAMPDLGVTEDHARDMAAYLSTLK